MIFIQTSRHVIEAGKITAIDLKASGCTIHFAASDKTTTLNAEEAAAFMDVIAELGHMDRVLIARRATEAA